jgi:steroid delta-isomerase
MAASDDAIRARIDTYLNGFGGDREAFLDSFADDAWIEDPVGSARLEGREAIGGFYDQTQSLAVSISLELTGPICLAGGEAAFPFQARPVMGGTTFRVDIIDVMTFTDDGRIATMRAFWDPATMAPLEG